jgi:uncharacterized protein
MSINIIESNILEQIIDSLVEGLKPNYIYLFGSQAYGTPYEGSDIDLLVVVPQTSQPRHQREAFAYDLLWGLTTPVDLIVLTQDEFDRTSQVKTSLVSKIIDQGEIVFHE